MGVGDRGKAGCKLGEVEDGSERPQELGPLRVLARIEVHSCPVLAIQSEERNWARQKRYQAAG
jgi:hypothetical protein